MISLVKLHVCEVRRALEYLEVAWYVNTHADRAHGDLTFRVCNDFVSVGISVSSPDCNVF